jgi:cellulose synthase/poly-beta-1,6-N-acetylglucosamine synthase-like glycosyltransferase
MPMSAALIVVGCALLLLALHPFITYPAILWLLARIRPRPVARGTPAGRVALCVCAYNEERVIRAKIENMLALQSSVSDLEILIYVDGSRDRTAEIVREFGDQIRLVASAERLGKSHGMNTLVRMTEADYLVFSDANVEFAPDALPPLLAPFADPDVGCVCGHLVYTEAVGTATATTGSLYWRLEELIKTYEGEIGSVMGADGSIFALRRSLHVPPPPDLIDDMFVSFSVLCSGHRIVRAADAYAYEESVHSPAEDFQRKIRIACQAFNVHRALWPELRRTSWLNLFQYVSHKLLRWLTIFLLGAGSAFLAAGLALELDVRVFVTLALVAAVCVAAIILKPVGKLATLREAFSAFVATGIGVVRSLRGERFQTWNPPASARGPIQTTAE